MKSQKTLSIILAAGAAGVALVALSNASFLATVPADLLIAASAAGAIVGLAIADYSRRIQPLKPLAPVVHPTFPKNATRTTAYGVAQRTCTVSERSAA
ncbi:MAG TPA: hypothetical protein VFJ90_06855 [Candidatus Didemnitutus sp.]|nr:hypothetical protein [Candidatus Didemnitutus sp.]